MAFLSAEPNVFDEPRCAGTRVIARIVVAFGDSITDGSLFAIGTYQRWPDILGRRLAAEPGPQRLSVVDTGIGSNRVLSRVLAHCCHADHPS